MSVEEVESLQPCQCRCELVIEEMIGPLCFACPRGGRQTRREAHRVHASNNTSAR
jgi:hypothetical protein